MGACISQNSNANANATKEPPPRMKHPTWTTAPSSSRRWNDPHNHTNHSNNNSNHSHHSHHSKNHPLAIASESTPATITTGSTTHPPTSTMARTSLVYDGLVRSHHHHDKSSSHTASTTTHKDNVNTNDNTPPTKSLQDYYDIIECIGRGSFSMVYKIRKKSDKIGGSSRPINTIPKSNSIGNSLHSTKSIINTSRHSSTNSLHENEETTDTNHLSPLLLQKTTLQRQRSLHQIQTDNEGNLFPHWTTTTTTTNTANRNGNSHHHHHSNTVPELLFVLKEMDLSTHDTLTTPSNHNNNHNKAQQQQQQQQYQLFMNEIEILKTLDHPHIIKIYETFTNTTHHHNKLQVVMEYCRGGDLYTRIPYLDEHIVRTMVTQMISAVHYLHERHILHRDLKWENLVFEQTSLYDQTHNTHTPVIKLIDFGVSYVIPNDHNTTCLTERIGTLYSMSPETILQNYSFPSDVWSCGVCCYMLLSAYGQAPFEAPTNKQVIQNILAGNYSMSSPNQNSRSTTTTTTTTTTTVTTTTTTTSKSNTNHNDDNHDEDIWKQRSEASKDFVRHLLVVNPTERYTIQQAQNHPWIQGEEPHSTTNVPPPPPPHHHRTTRSNRTTQSSSNTTTTTPDRLLGRLDRTVRRQVQEAMIRYAFSTGDFMKLALNVLAKQAGAQEIDDLRTIFETINTERTGTISYDEFRHALFPNDDTEDTTDENQYSDEYITKLFHQLDVNKNNVITYTEFIAAILEMHGKIEEYRFAEAFDQLNCDDSGYISKENIRELLGDDVDEAYIDKLIAEADYLNDGQISYGEFKQAFRDQMRFLVSSIRSRSSLSEILKNDSELSDRNTVDTTRPSK